MHHPLTDIQADFDINRSVRYQITAKRKYFHRRTDGQTDGQTSRTTIGSFFRKKTTKNQFCYTLAIWGISYEEICKNMLRLMRFGVYFESSFENKWLSSYRKKS